MKMPEEFYRTGNYETDHATFGGLIYYSDFNTEYRKENDYGSSIASRITSDWKFDESCKKNLQDKTKCNNWRTNK